MLVHLPNYSWEQGAFLFAFGDTQRFIADLDLARLQKKMQEFEAFYAISEWSIEMPKGYEKIAYNKDWYGHFYEFENLKCESKK